jgi:hypothetical protein
MNSMSLLKNTNFLLAVTVASLLTTAYSYNLYQQTNQELMDLKKNPNKVAQQEAKDLVARVGALVALPTGEEPTIATVTDINKLKNQAFFKNAQNGDKVLLYAKALKAYLYSVSMNKILEVAPITVNQNPGQVAGVETDKATPTPTSKK